MVDRVLVLAKGHQLFFGPADGAEAWFTHTLGFKRPQHDNPADFILDQVRVYKAFECSKCVVGGAVRVCGNRRT
jgi:hypothetical protein